MTVLSGQMCDQGILSCINVKLLIVWDAIYKSNHLYLLPEL